MTVEVVDEILLGIESNIYVPRVIRSIQKVLSLTKSTKGWDDDCGDR